MYFPIGFIEIRNMAFLLVFALSLYTLLITSLIFEPAKTSLNIKITYSCIKFKGSKTLSTGFEVFSFSSYT